MPIPFIFSSGSLFGASFTRVRGLFLAGVSGSTTAGPIAPAAGIALVQPALVLSSAGMASQIVSTAAAAISAANYVYIPQTTGPVSTSSFAGMESAPPQTGMGAALIFNAATRRLGIFSTADGTGTWYWSHTGITTSAGAAGFTSSGG